MQVIGYVVVSGSKKIVNFDVSSGGYPWESDELDSTGILTLERARQVVQNECLMKYIGGPFSIHSLQLGEAVQ